MYGTCGSTFDLPLQLLAYASKHCKKVNELLLLLLRVSGRYHTENQNSLYSQISFRRKFSEADRLNEKSFNII